MSGLVGNSRRHVLSCRGSYLSGKKDFVLNPGIENMTLGNDKLFRLTNLKGNTSIIKLILGRSNSPYLKLNSYLYHISIK